MTYSHPYSRRAFCLLALGVHCVTLSCGSKESEDDGYLKHATILPLGKILGHTKTEVEAALGNSISDTGPTDSNPLNLCDYPWKEATEPFYCIVGYSGGRAVSVCAWLNHMFHSPEAAVKMVGIDVSGQAPSTVATAGKWWSGRIGDIEFKRIGSNKGDPGTDEWNFVKAEIALP